MEIISAKKYFLDKKYSYMGSRSKGSILGNIVRGAAKGVVLMAHSKLSPKVSREEAKKMTDKHGMKFGHKDELNAGPAYYNSEDHKVTAKDWIRTKHVMNHEIGHGIQKNKKGSFNNQRMTGEYSKSLEKAEDGASTIRAEREAWITAKKLNGGKESKSQKFARKAALGSYEDNLNAMDQVEKLSKDEDYKKKMYRRTGVKLAGAAIGGTSGYGLSHVLTRKLGKKIKALEGTKKKTLDQKKELIKLVSRRNLIKKVGTATGAVAGYAVAKKYFTKSID